MLKRSGAAVVGFTVALLLLMAGGAGAGNSSRFTPVDEGIIDAKLLPLGASSAPVRVMLEMSGNPVAAAQGDAGRKLSKDEKKQIKDQLKSQQSPVESAVANLGGKVLGDYQAAYNGVKVELPGTKIGEAAAIPGVIAVHGLEVMKPDNVNGVPLVNAPAVWDGLNGLHGEGIKIAIIDTGIDYTHADFGGPGTPAAYTTAHAAETSAADPAMFGPAAPKVKGGFDFVGDAYNASSTAPAAAHIPHPDPNPLDCFGHGSHVAGTAAGFGVLSNGTTYSGAYNASTISSHTWNVGPGVAPKADLYALRVFGCAGSTDVTVDAIEWAVDHDMDVINMSLGSPFGTDDDPSAVASTNAAKAGIVVVASAGNSGPGQYITGSPSTGTGAISVAANDPQPGFPGVQLALSTGQTIVSQNSNGATVANGTTLDVKVLRNADSSVSLGCKHPSGSPAFGADGSNEWATAGVAGKLAVVIRGTCARVARAVFGQKEGAAAVAMINTATSFPPFEGHISGNPDTGEAYDVSIPFLGVRNNGTAAVNPPQAASDAGKLVAADGGTATLSNVLIANPTYKAFASFTSGGPRNGDSALKPDVTAPGVSIASVGMGTGNGPAVMSGTSMAAPHTSGVAALTVQAHPGWKEEQLKAAIVNTADPAGVAGYSTRLGGTGFVNAFAATHTQAVALGEHKTPQLSFGFEDLKHDFHHSQNIKVRNNGDSAITFAVTHANDSGSAHTVSFDSSSITVPAHGDADLHVTLDVPVATVGDATSFHDVAGLVVLTPTSGQNSDVVLRVPFYFVPRADSNIDAKLAKKDLSPSSPTTTATITNHDGAIAGNADFYAWGLEDKNDKGKFSADVRAVGTSSFDAPTSTDTGRKLLVFAINTFSRFSNAATDEIDVFVDVNNDGKDDYDVVGSDLGFLQTGSSDGTPATAVFPISYDKDGKPVFGAPNISFLSDAPTDGTTILLPVRFQSTRTTGLSTRNQLCMTPPAAVDGQPCLDAAHPRFTYHVVSFDRESDFFDVVPGAAKFNPFHSSITTGDFVTVKPDETGTSDVAIDTAEWAQTPALGVMIVSEDNKAGKEEATLLPLKLKKK
jgi:minor extracellular serine protease Vpr